MAADAEPMRVLTLKNEAFGEQLYLTAELGNSTARQLIAPNTQPARISVVIQGDKLVGLELVAVGQE